MPISCIFMTLTLNCVAGTPINSRGILVPTLSRFGSIKASGRLSHQDYIVVASGSDDIPPSIIKDETALCRIDIHGLSTKFGQRFLVGSSTTGIIVLSTNQLEDQVGALSSLEVANQVVSDCMV